MKKALLFVFLPLLVAAQEFPAEELDAFLDSLEKKKLFFGAVHLLHKGNTVYQKSVGFKDQDLKEKLDIDTPLRIGSITKTFTSTLVFKAEEQGLLKRYETLDLYFPEFPKGNLVKIDHLLNHSSGIHNFTNDATYAFYRTQEKSKEQLMQLIQKGGFDFEPGVNASYSNSNYLLLTFILEKCWQKSFGDILKEQILEPLDLKNTNFIPEKESAVSFLIGDRISAYAPTHLSIPLGAGAITSTAEDLNIFFTHLFKGKLVSDSSLTFMKEQNMGYGRGLFTFPYGSRKAYGHTGGIDGFNAISAFFEEDEFAITLLSNGSSYDRNEILLHFLDGWYTRQLTLPDWDNPALKIEEVEGFLGTYSSKDIPLKLKISLEEGILMGQATGQAAFALAKKSETSYWYKPSKIQIDFLMEEKALKLQQGGKSYLFTKEM